MEVLHKYNYEKLDDFLYKIKHNTTENLICNFLISFSKSCYHGEKFKHFFQDVRNNLLNNSDYIQSTKYGKFKVGKIQIDSGDTLSRHNWYYKFMADYMEKNHLSSEDDVADKIKEEMSEKAYHRGKLQGKEWLVENLDAINLFIPEGHKISSKINLTDDITILYEGDEKYPTVEYICYDHWLNHPRYKIVNKALSEVCKLENNNSVVERSFWNDVKFFKKIYEKYYQQTLPFIDFFDRQSYKYLFDETVAHIVKNYCNIDNLIEFYNAGIENKSTITLRGRKAQNDPIIKKFLQNELVGVEERKFVSVKSF